MISCTKCTSPRILNVYAKCNDMFVAKINHHVYEGYVIEGVDPIRGSSDEVGFSVCLECGQIQGNWPVPELPLERGMKINYNGEEEPIE